MPQFDQSSFLNQVFWFLFFFFAFYFFVSYYFLPSLCKNIKFRNKKILKNNQDLIEINFEKNKKKTQLNFFYNLFFLNFESFLKKIKDINLEKKNSMKKEILKNRNLNDNIVLFISKYVLLFNIKK